MSRRIQSVVRQRRINVMVRSPVGAALLVRQRGMTERTPNGGIRVDVQDAAQSYGIPAKPSDTHAGFWRLDFSSPARSGYATLL